MEATTIRRKTLLPFLCTKKNRALFAVINVYLAIGFGSLVITLFYLMLHLNHPEAILGYCIPGLVLGVSSGIFYFVGYQSMLAEQRNEVF